MEKLAERLRSQGVKLAKRAPLWTGPNGDGPNGGITQGLIGRWLVCRERCRIHAVLGLRPAPSFDPKLEFGSMWHVMEESLSGEVRHFGERVGTTAQEDDLKKHCQDLCKRFPLQQEQIDHWYQIAKALFPRYVAHWSKHPDAKGRKPLLQEQVFDVPYQLPSGRAVRLRGKWDAVDFLPAHSEGGVKWPAGIWLQENKTKSSIDAVKIGRQVKFDLQTMLYLIALWEGRVKWVSESGNPILRDCYAGRKDLQILGVRYNVVRRSAHKTVESMLKKVDEDAAAGRSGEWFARWKVGISAADIARFKKDCLDPILENMLDDWEWWNHCQKTNHNPFQQNCIWRSSYGSERGNSKERAHVPRHYRMPFGVYNVIAEGGFGDVDAFLETGSEVGLQRATVMYPEL